MRPRATAQVPGGRTRLPTALLAEVRAAARLSGAGRAVAILVTILSPEGTGGLEAVSCSHRRPAHLAQRRTGRRAHPFQTLGPGAPWLPQPSARRSPGSARVVSTIPGRGMDHGSQAARSLMAPGC